MLKYLFLLVGILVGAIAAYFALTAPKRGKQSTDKDPPIAAETAKTEDAVKKRSFMDIIDEMEGHEFEYFCAELLKRYGYSNIHVTKASGDQGVDIVAYHKGIRCAFQCKRYSSKIGNEAIQQVNAGRQLYSCFRAVVITNNYFTRSAKEIAQVTNVELWDRDVLKDKVKRVLKDEKELKKLMENKEKSYKE